MKSVYQIREYEAFYSADPKSARAGRPGLRPMDEKTFAQLENFILSNRGTDTEPLELMGFSARKGIGKIITAKNYVGIITMQDGTMIEILPKIYSSIDDDENGTRTKKVLIRMLRTLREGRYKTFQSSNVSIEKMNIFEIFIRMFIYEVLFITKRGLKSGYETIQENSSVFKGKMLFSEQLKKNLVHQERNFIEYDDFTTKRPENRLLKSTLRYLYRQTASLKNKKDLKLLLNIFEDIPASENYRLDFEKISSDRSMKDYRTALMWSKTFLMGKSFTSFSGSEVAVALLFPMETLFESYVARLVKRHFSGNDYAVSVQDKKFHLFDLGKKKFQLRPDIVVRRKSDGAVYMMDTKWKILDEKKFNYGISQADMYQMYAYQKKYGAEEIVLIYPKTDKVMDDAEIRYRSKDGVSVRVEFIDLFDN